VSGPVLHALKTCRINTIPLPALPAPQA